MIDAIAPATLTTIARHVFGPATQVASTRKIATRQQHGLVRVAESTRNLLYVVHLAAHAHPYVFRFARTPGEDVYDREVRNYRRLADHTGVRVPTVYAVDRTQRIAPTAYMVMDYLSGEHWTYLVHPDNPETTPSEKAAIQRRVGQFYARVHGVTQKTAPSHVETRNVLHTLDRLEAAAARGVLSLASGTIARCRQAVWQETGFRKAPHSLCLIDAELHFARHENRWKLAFVCDAEWVRYRNRHVDLTTMLNGPSAWWEADRPLADADATQVAEQPLFRGYEAVRPIDYAKLLHLSPYYELGRWAQLAVTSPPEKKQWIKTCKEPLIQALVDRLAARA